MQKLHFVSVPEILTDLRGLEKDLRTAVSGEVRFDAGSRALYASDASNYRQVPICVVIPRTIDDVVAAVAVARRYGAPILSRGTGTSIAGQCCNTAVVLDFSKYLNRIIEVDPKRRIARVEPGVVLDDLRNAAEEFGLTFGPDPATHRWCTLGGMIGNNSCGVHSVMAGRTVDNIEALEVLLYDGTRLNVGPDLVRHSGQSSTEHNRASDIQTRLAALAKTYTDEIHRTFPPIPRRVSGYSIDQLMPENGFHIARSLVGSEGTLVTILEATVRLIPSPPKRVLLVAGFTDIAVAGDQVPLVLEHKPIGLEGMDRRLTNAMQKKHLHPKPLAMMPGGDAWILAEFGEGSTEAAIQAAGTLAEKLKVTGMVDHKVFVDPVDQKSIWSVRDSALGAISRTPGEKDNWEGWEDAAVPPAQIGAYLRDFRALLNRYDYSGAMYGHIGDGCMHNRIDWDPTTQEGIDKWLKFVDEAADLVISYGGSISGEHGDGQARGALLPKMFGPKIMQAFEEFKTIWDPDWNMNPGKLIRPNRIDSDLRHGPHAPSSLLHTQTHFHYPDDDGRFERALERCVGAGVCRKDDGLMCPSYMATREEEHVTRGRTHLLWEMMRGEVIPDGWKSEDVKDALDLCLACKGCKGECPVHVDVATYKAEFLSHYYEGRVRPRGAYAMGMISIAARVASRAPSIVNMLTHAPITSAIAKKLAGIHPKREIPRFAKQTFKQWFFKTHAPSLISSGPVVGAQHSEEPPPHPLLLKEGEPARQATVILWADTFNNYFRPETAIAATQVLEDAGFSVKVHKRTMCCGRPLYDWGMLEKAKGQLVEIMTLLADDIAAGTPIVVLEPSCASVFRDELLNLFSKREDAKRLSESVYLLSEFLDRFAPSYRPATEAKAGLSGAATSGTAIVQLHCHHQSILNKEAEKAVIDRCDIHSNILSDGCCGMAGAFGFDENHYELSMQIGERKVLPHIRQTPEDHIVIADGFSCREQIEQATGRKTHHLAEVLAMAMSDDK